MLTELMSFVLETLIWISLLVFSNIIVCTFFSSVTFFLWQIILFFLTYNSEIKFLLEMTTILK